jgi:hypothetical protein
MGMSVTKFQVSISCYILTAIVDKNRFNSISDSALLQGSLANGMEGAARTRQLHRGAPHRQNAADPCHEEKGVPRQNQLTEHNVEAN